MTWLLWSLDHCIELVASKESTISQVARMIRDRFYRLSFAVGDAMNTCMTNMIVEIPKLIGNMCI